MLLYILILLELGSRSYWTIKHGMPFFSRLDDWYGMFYTELNDSGVRQADLRAGDERFDVLFLGASALDRIHRGAADEISAGLSAATGRDVRIFNLARPALSTRDSLIKYSRLLADKRFDLVVVYHGINDTRLNNCPADRFRDDYTHAGWYAKLKRLEANKHLLAFWTLPYTVEYMAINAASGRGFRQYVPRHRPNKAWLAHGGDIKTAQPFGQNLQEIIQIAQGRGEPVLLMSFAWYVPADYSLEKFKARQLDYVLHASPLEVWGIAANVTEGLRVHNGVIREAAGRFDNVIFVDLERAVPKRGEFFDDVCHLSDKGKKLATAKFLSEVADFLRSRTASK